MRSNNGDGCAHLRRFFSLILAFLLVFAAAPGQERFLESGFKPLQGPDAGLLSDSPTRLKIDLSGQWSFEVEGGEKGTILVPSAYDFTGKVTFTRNFTVTAEQIDAHHFHLVFFGVNHSCDIFVNGEFLYNHQGGYSTVVVPLPLGLIQVGGENVVRLVVSNVLDPRRTIPVRMAVGGWRSYGGITRDIALIGTPPMYIRHVAVRSSLGAGGATGAFRATVQVDGSIQLPDSMQGSGAVPAVYCDVLDKLTGASIARSGPVTLARRGTEWEQATVEVTVPEAKPWTPSTPDLYVVRITLVLQAQKRQVLVDQQDIVSGLRTVAVAGGDILLNGQRIVLKGVAWHEDHPTWGSAMSYEDRERDIVQIRNLGANVVRFAGHPPHPYMLNLCDRYGLLAMVELPLVGVSGAVQGDEAFVDLAVASLREMILRDVSHPSVLAWGLGDGNDVVHPAGRALLDLLVERARETDARPVYAGFRMLPGEEASAAVDIAGLNVSAGDLKTFKSLIADWRGAHRSNAVIVLRMGSEVLHDNRNGYSDPLSQQAQARYFLQRFDALRSEDYDGGIVWSFQDWRSDRPSLTANTADPYLNGYGLVSEQREKRIAYDAVRAVFTGEKFAALPIGTASDTSPMIYVLTGFVLLVGLAYFYNANRRFRDSLGRSMLNSFNFFSDVRDQHVVSSVQSAILGISASIALALTLSSVAYHFRSSLFLDNLLSLLLVSDSLKTAAISLIRTPALFLLYGSIAIFLTLLLIAGVILLLRFVVRTRAYPYHAFSVAMWSTPPLLLLVPIGMILYRVIQSSAYVLPAFVIILVLLVWVAVRLLKGISIIFDIRQFRVYAVAAMLILLVGGGLYLYYETSVSLPTTASFLYQQLVSAR